MNMIEQVAEALWQNDSIRALGRNRLESWEIVSDASKDTYRGMAYAAIEAMREPDDETIVVGVKSCDCWEMNKYAVSECWKDMIDAALNEK